MAQLVTTYSALTWSVDGTLVTKTRAPSFDARRRFRNELRINRLLSAHRLPVSTPTLVDFDVQHRRLTFEAVHGEQLGPKYPLELSDSTIDTVVELAHRLRRFNPQRRWLRRFDTARRLALARRFGLLTDAQTIALSDIAERIPRPVRFGHGDLTARNILRDPNGLVLIDWEWAGLYPQEYDLAFLWYSLVDVEHGRERVEKYVDIGESSFLLSALLIQLWHLQWYVPNEHRHKHLSTRDDLINRLCH